MREREQIHGVTYRKKRKRSLLNGLGKLKINWIGEWELLSENNNKNMRTFTTIPYRVSLLGTGKHFYNFVPLLSFCGTSPPLGISENTYKNTLGTVSFRFSYFIMLSLDMTFYLYI